SEHHIRLLYGYSYRSVLHSFPTRRSSDLGVEWFAGRLLLRRPRGLRARSDRAGRTRWRVELPAVPEPGDHRWRLATGARLARRAGDDVAGTTKRAPPSATPTAGLAWRSLIEVVVLPPSTDRSRITT